MTKLLNKPLKAFGLYSMVILLISIPAYVIVVDHIWVSELDENNWLILQHTKRKLDAIDFSGDDIEKLIGVWDELHPGLSITKTDESNIREDSTYEIVRSNEFDPKDGDERFRGLRSTVDVKGNNYQIVVETNIENSAETMLAIALVTSFFFAILIFGFIVLNRRIALSSWRSFYETLQALKSFDLTKDNELVLPVSEIQEFQELNLSLHQLVKKNIDTYRLQKAFTENASHELQTPIALLKSKIDLLLQEKNLTPEISEILGGIEAPLARLSRINKNLLLLAKVENHQYNDQEQLDVEEYVNSSLVLFEDYISEKSLAVDARFKEHLEVNANSFLLETLLHNLLSNAIRHTPNGGQLQIRIEAKTLIIVNSGSTALDEKHLFVRFSTSSKEKISSGLGLAIVKEISNKYNWKIKYHFDENDHHFSVSFE